ncbi:MAG: zinc carboxypeptidase [Oligoflexia bacterium]|nr:zinc carboxypeptidase [Oligoflexia bacterium]
MTFPELEFLEAILEEYENSIRIQTRAKIDFHGKHFPIYSLSMGNPSPTAPTLAFVGGVHGQEKIGSQVVLSYLATFLELAKWDELTQNILEKIRICFLPIVNPVGMFLIRRGNANRVDIMRNSPLDAIDSALPMLQGQRFSPYLPWYRGKKGDPLEIETQVLIDFIKTEVLPAKASLALDCHSGYGTVDRLWFPYSHTAKPFPHLAETFALKNLLDLANPNHIYRMEPTTKGYAISGDVWDFLYEEHRKTSDHIFLPLTLEMGSWLWLKKNPLQIFSNIGLFHPIHLHRHKRILRRHLFLFDFFTRAVLSSNSWGKLEAAEKETLHKQALDYWYFEE